VPGYQSAVWFGLFAPSGTAQEIVTAINAEVQKVLSDREFRETFLLPNYYEPLVGSASQFSDLVKSDATKWGTVMRDAKINLD
jgi:tripartite-type tricarboxylate transporter receptor subunit TctC